MKNCDFSVFYEKIIQDKKKLNLRKIDFKINVFVSNA